MTVEEKLRTMIVEKYGNLSKFTKQIDMANSTLSTIMKKGIHKANVSNIIKICKALDISADELAHDRIVPNGKKLLMPMTDLDEIVQSAKANIIAYDHLTLDDEPLSEDDRQTILDALELCLEFIKRQHMRNCK